MTTTPLPPIPANTPHLTRRIRACENEVPAQVVLDFEDLLHDDQRKAYELARTALKETP